MGIPTWVSVTLSILVCIAVIFIVVVIITAIIAYKKRKAITEGFGKLRSRFTKKSYSPSKLIDTSSVKWKHTTLSPQEKALLYQTSQ